MSTAQLNAYYSTPLHCYSKYSKPKLRQLSSEEVIEYYNRVMGGSPITHIAKEEGKSVTTIHNALYCYARSIGKEPELHLQVKVNFKNLPRKPRKTNNVAIAQYTRTGELVQEYESLTEASRSVGCSVPSISKALRGHNETCYGYIWKYKETE